MIRAILVGLMALLVAGPALASGRQRGDTTSATSNAVATGVGYGGAGGNVSHDGPRAAGAASVYFGDSCSRGLSAQGAGFGGAMGDMDPLCALQVAYTMAVADGKTSLASSLALQAFELATARVAAEARCRTTFGGDIPLVGELLRPLQWVFCEAF